MGDSGSTRGYLAGNPMLSPRKNPPPFPVRLQVIAVVNRLSQIGRHTPLSLFKNNRNGSFLLVADVKKKGVEECILRCSQTFRKTGKLAFLQSDLDSADTLIRYIPVRRKSELWTIQSSVNGLFMLRRRSTRSLMAWNPSIRKTRIVPPSPFTSRGMFTFDDGLGFDPLSELYKHVVVAVSLDTYDLQLFAVYTFRTNSWKSIELPIREDGSSKWLSPLSFTMGRSVCIRGVIVYSLSESITPTGPGPLKFVLFDLSNEVFSTIRFPVKVPHSHLHFQALTMGDGQCSLGGSVWVLDANSSEGWTQLYAFCTRLLFPKQYIRSLRSNPIYLNKKAKMLLKRGPWLKSYDLETRKEKTLMQKKDLSKDRIWMYMENLYRFD